MGKRASWVQGVWRRRFGWAALGIAGALGVFVLGGVILRLLDRRYRALAVYVAFGIFALLWVTMALYLAAKGSRSPQKFLRRALLRLLLSVVIGGIFIGVLVLQYNGEMTNDGRYAPRDMLVFDDGEILRRHIVVYEPGNLLWTGPRSHNYGYDE